MANTVSGINKPTAGTCPHGCAPSACPICSGMGGGGFRPGERAQKPGEMSYHQCAMLGALMRSREAQAKAHEQNLQNQIEALRNFEQNLVKISEKLASLAAKMSQNVVMKPLAFVINKVALPIVNVMKNIPSNVQKVFDKFNQLKTDIQDKLNAIFGEAKAFIQKKVSELVSVIKSKFNGIFKIFKRNNTKDDETKIDEDKKIFRLKTFINKLLRRNNDTEDKS